MGPTGDRMGSSVAEIYDKKACLRATIKRVML